tara:strand:- start:3918 stop:4352 length:435 start_codon:yes stop_codon:yes gene_type:complete
MIDFNFETVALTTVILLFVILCYAVFIRPMIRKMPDRTVMEDDFDDFMEKNLSSSAKTSAQLKKELDEIEKSFNKTNEKPLNLYLDMTGLSGRAIVALKDLHVKDINALRQISCQHLYDMKGVGKKTVEDIQSWAKGSYNIKIK